MTAAIYTAQLDSVVLALRLLYYGERLSFHVALNSGDSKAQGELKLIRIIVLKIQGLGYRGKDRKS